MDVSIFADSIQLTILTFKEVGMRGKHWECKYCDCTSKSQSPYEEKGFYVCSRCGAEWEDCKILVEDEDYDDEEYLTFRRKKYV